MQMSFLLPPLSLLGPNLAQPLFFCLSFLLFPVRLGNFSREGKRKEEDKEATTAQGEKKKEEERMVASVARGDKIHRHPTTPSPPPHPHFRQEKRGCHLPTNLTKNIEIFLRQINCGL